MLKPDADYLFEISWEVCNKVGGINTVIKSKLSKIIDAYKNYILIGPYFEDKAKLEFIPTDPPQSYLEILNELRNEGIFCHYGYWINSIENSKNTFKEDKLPTVILIDFKNFLYQKDYIKYLMWENFKIDSLRGYWDFEEPSIWSYCAGKLIERLTKKLFREKKVVAQFHEWLTGFGLLYLKKNCENVATVFTTHATVLGRTLASERRDINLLINQEEINKEIYAHNIEAKHLTEKAAALNSDIFTTVSEVTADETEKFLGRRPEVLLYNGLNSEEFPDFEDISIKHLTSRDRLREFLIYYFFPYYSFNIDNTLIFYTSGRYEYIDKGYDIIIQTLSRLNQILKEERQSEKNNYYNNLVNKKDNNYNNNKNENNDNDKKDLTIILFFWVPMSHQGIRLDVLENKNYYMCIKNSIMSNYSQILKNIIYDLISNKETNKENVFTERILGEIKKELVSFKRKGTPPLSTHYIDESTNSILTALKNNGLTNNEDDVVKVIIEPVYLEGNDGFIDLNYYDVIVGTDLGLFPSFYEPWGYTPLESISLGVPAVTTDLSGFGTFMKKNVIEKNENKKGLYVLERKNKSNEIIVNELTNTLLEFIKMSRKERNEQKLKAKQLSTLADWNIFIDYYIKAHNLALKKK